jgi:hypothetical protein
LAGECFEAFAMVWRWGRGIEAELLVEGNGFI